MSRRGAAAVRPAARRATQVLRTAARNRWIALASLVDQGIIRRPHYVHEHELTDAQRGDIAAVLEDWMRHPLSWSVQRDPASDISVAYHAGFLLAASWLLLSGTEAPELAAVLREHRIDLHPDWWLEDGWGDYHAQYGLRCPDCRGYTYALPNGIYLEPHDMDWPHRCGGCGAALPTQHRTHVFGSQERFWSDCCCGWATDELTAHQQATDAATDHVTAARATQGSS